MTKQIRRKWSLDSADVRRKKSRYNSDYVFTEFFVEQQIKIHIQSSVS
jgi:hypothetical protein